MRRIRRALGAIATLWLCCQAGSMTLSAAIIGMLPFADQAPQPCTCVHAAGHHHGGGHRAARPATSVSLDRHLTCQVHSADPGSAVSLVTVVGSLGLLAAVHVSLFPAIPTTHRGPTRTPATDRVLPPNPSPPHA